VPGPLSAAHGPLRTHLAKSSPAWTPRVRWRFHAAILRLARSTRRRRCRRAARDRQALVSATVEFGSPTDWITWSLSDAAGQFVTDLRGLRGSESGEELSRRVEHPIEGGEFANRGTPDPRIPDPGPRIHASYRSHLGGGLLSSPPWTEKPIERGSPSHPRLESRARAVTVRGT
jgi:hypothetical protein